jgi:hypothetical protein
MKSAASLSPDELAAVVRRASELDAVLPRHESDLDVDDARSVLREAGLSPGAAEQALEEWRRGEIVVQPPPPLDSARLLPPIVSIERAVPLDSAAVQARLDGVLRRQWFTRGRRYGTAGCEWLPRSGLLADLRRRLDVRGTLLLHDVGRVRVELRPGAAGTSLARVSADLGAYRSRLVGGMVVAPVAAGAVASLIGIPAESIDLIAAGLPVGLALAGGGYLGAARSLDRRKVRVEDSLHILLDRAVGEL